MMKTPHSTYERRTCVGRSGNAVDKQQHRWFILLFAFFTVMVILTTASASKPGYKAGSAEKGVLVKGYGEIVVNAQAKDGQPIAGAAVKIDGASIGNTDAQGKFAIEMGQGTHTVEVCANGYCQSKTTEITHNGDVDELKFICDWCTGNLAVAVVSPSLSPISNAYVQIDGKQVELTNTSGAAYFKGKLLGTHTVKVFLIIKETPAQAPQYFEATVQVDLNSPYQLRKFVLSTQGMAPMSADAPPNLLIMAPQEATQEMESAAVVKGRIPLNLDQTIMQPISLENDQCAKEYWLAGKWPAECDTKNIWIADESLVTTAESQPIALACADAKCFKDSAITLASYIYPQYPNPYSTAGDFFGTDGIKYKRMTYTENGGGSLANCLKRLGISMSQVILHINNKIAVPNVGKRIEPYNQHIGEFKENGKDCTVFYEPRAFETALGLPAGARQEEALNKACQKSCTKGPQDYIRYPPVPYPGIIPDYIKDKMIDDAIKHNHVENGWPSLAGYNPFADISIILPSAAAVTATAFIVWEMAKPIRCIVAGLWAIGTWSVGTPGSVLLCAT